MCGFSLPLLASNEMSHPVSGVSSHSGVVLPLRFVVISFGGLPKPRMTQNEDLVDRENWGKHIISSPYRCPFLLKTETLLPLCL